MEIKEGSYADLPIYTKANLEAVSALESKKVDDIIKGIFKQWINSGLLHEEFEYPLFTSLPEKIVTEALMNQAHKRLEYEKSLIHFKKEYPTLYNLFKKTYDYVLEFGKNNGKIYSANCPHCTSTLHIYVSKMGTKNTCPNCNKWVSFNENGYTQAADGKQGFCFITTAVCTSLGKDDNCIELNTFRSFRDIWIIKQYGGRKLINDYYITAPSIVRAINNESNSHDIYKAIWQNYLYRCFQYITIKKFKKAKNLYINMVKELKKIYLHQE